MSSRLRARGDPAEGYHLRAGLACGRARPPQDLLNPEPHENQIHCKDRAEQPEMQAAGRPLVVAPAGVFKLDRAPRHGSIPFYIPPARLPRDRRSALIVRIADLVKPVEPETASPGAACF